MPADAPLMEEGLDSLGAVDLGRALQDATGVEMPATLVFDYPTVAAIAGFVDGMRNALGTNSSDRKTVHADKHKSDQMLRQSVDVALSGVHLDQTTSDSAALALSRPTCRTPATLDSRVGATRAPDACKPLPVNRFDADSLGV